MDKGGHIENVVLHLAYSYLLKTKDLMPSSMVTRLMFLNGSLIKNDSIKSIDVIDLMWSHIVVKYMVRLFWEKAHAPLLR